MPSRDIHPIALLIDELLRLTPRLRSAISDETVGLELSRMELTALAAIVDADVPPTVPQIGRSLGHPRQVIQRSVNVLLARDLVEAAPNPNHKRAPLLLATPAGVALKADVDGQLHARMEALSAVLGEESCVRLTHQLRATRRAVETYIKESEIRDVGR